MRDRSNRVDRTVRTTKKVSGTPSPNPLQLEMPEAATIFGSSSNCRKCQGWIMVQVQDHSPTPEIRCINCGWRPQYHDRIQSETTASLLMREATTKLVQEDIVKRRLGQNS